MEHIFRNVTIVTGVATLALSVPAMHFFGIVGAAAVTGLSALGSKLALVWFELRSNVKLVAPEATPAPVGDQAA